MLGSAGEHTARVASLLVSLLGRGAGTCLDVCCGTGARAAVLASLGWRPVGVDLSMGQLGYGARRLPVALADAVALPVRSGSVRSGSVRSGSVPAAVVVHAHTTCCPRCWTRGYGWTRFASRPPLVFTRDLLGFAAVSPSSSS